MGHVAVPARMVLMVSEDAAALDEVSDRLAEEQGTTHAGVWAFRTATLAEAVSILRSSPVDVVVVDIDAENAAGLDSVRYLRRLSSVVPIVAFGATLDGYEPSAIYRAGGQEVLRRPLKASVDVSATLRRAIARQEPAREHAADIGHRDMDRDRAAVLAAVLRETAPVGGLQPLVERAAAALVPNAADCAVIIVTGHDASCIIEVSHVDGDAADRLRENLDRLLREPPDIAGFVALDDTGVDVRGRVIAALEAAGMESIGIGVIRQGHQESGLIVLASPVGDVRGIDPSFAVAVAELLGPSVERERMIATLTGAINTVAHDLINPLTTIAMAAATLASPTPPEDARPIVDLIQRSADLMQNIARDLSDRASLEMRRLRLDREVVTAQDAVDGIRQLIEPVAAEREISLRCDTASHTPPLFADRARLTRAVSNMVRTAIALAPVGGRVELSVRGMHTERSMSGTRRRERLVEFSIHANGPGIPVDELRQVFSWFWHSDTAPRGGGGIGLAVAKGLIEAHGGSVRVSSVAGEGTSFIVHLPAAVFEETSP